MFEHGLRKLVDQRRRVLVDRSREVDGACSERSHIGTQRERPAAFGGIPTASTGGELDDHAGAVLADALLYGREKRGIRRRRLVRVAHVNVHQRGARLEGLLGRLDLLGGRDRHRRIRGLAGLRTGNGAGDDDRIGHVRASGSCSSGQ